MRVRLAGIGARWKFDLGRQRPIARRLRPQVVKGVYVVPGIGARRAECIATVGDIECRGPPGRDTADIGLPLEHPDALRFRIRREWQRAQLGEDEYEAPVAGTAVHELPPSAPCYDSATIAAFDAMLKPAGTPVER